MKRRTLDALLTMGGLIVALVLLAAGGLLFWAHDFVDDNVHTQLSEQQIFFPPKGEATASPEIGPFINKYAGKQLTNGEQAKAYADHFIKVHLDEATGGKTYSELSAAARANPDDAKAKGLVELAFKGETLRGLLLNAYAFGTMGKIALIAAIASFVGAGLLLLLSILGFMHLRRVSPEQEVLTGHVRSTTPAMA